MKHAKSKSHYFELTFTETAEPVSSQLKPFRSVLGRSSLRHFLSSIFVFFLYIIAFILLTVKDAASRITLLKLHSS